MLRKNDPLFASRRLSEGVFMENAATDRATPTTVNSSVRTREYLTAREIERLNGGRQEVEPLRPSGRNHDPDWLSPRLAGVRVVRSAMVAGRAGHRPATRPQGEERLAQCPPDAGRRDTRAATPAARTGGILVRLHDRAGRADDAQSLPCAIRSDRGSGQNAVSDPSAHAATRLRLCPGERRSRHTGATGLARPQEHPAHGALH